MITRRDVLVAGGSAAATALLLQLPWGSNVPAESAADRAALVSGLGTEFDAVFADLQSTRALGEAWLAGEGSGSTREGLAKALRERLGNPADGDGVERDLSEVVRTDMLEGRICEVDGWQLADSECRLAALWVLARQEGG